MGSNGGGGGIWKLGDRHGGKPSVAWKLVGNICKYSHRAFSILLLLAAYLCEWHSLQGAQTSTVWMQDEEKEGNKDVLLQKRKTF